jgi:penicillin-binding protein 2
MRRTIPLVTDNSQSYTFTRRAMVVGGFQLGLSALMAGRLAYLSLSDRKKYQLASEENRFQLVLVPPRRGWIVDRYGKPIAVNRSDYRIDLIPDQLEDPERVIAQLAQLLELDPEEIVRIREELKVAAGYQPVAVAENIAYEKYAAVTVRLPEMPGVAPLRGFSRFYPDGAAVGHLIGYVGTANKEEYEAEDKNRLLVTPGFKIGKEVLKRPWKNACAEFREQSAWK